MRLRTRGTKENRAVKSVRDNILKPVILDVLFGLGDNVAGVDSNDFASTRPGSKQRQNTSTYGIISSSDFGARPRSRGVTYRIRHPLQRLL